MPRRQRPHRTRPTVALYHRVSTVDQDPNLAARELHATARRHGFRVVLDERETGRGTSAQRPGLARIMRAVHAGDVDVVMVWKLDRFGRSVLDLQTRLRDLEVAGVRFMAITQGVDVDPRRPSATGRLLYDILAAIAEWERELISERTRLGMAAARRAGKQLGPPRKQRPSPAAVAKLRAEGLSLRGIADRLGCSVWLVRSSGTDAPSTPAPRRR